MNRIMGFTEAWHMLQDIWKLYKKYAARKLNDDELEKLIYEADKIHKKYKYPFTKDIIVALISELERSVNHFREVDKRDISS